MPRSILLFFSVAALGVALSACASSGPPSPVPIAATIAPSDTSTSTVIAGTGPSIRCGRVPVTTHSDVQYDTTPGGRPLRLDVQVPTTPGPKPLVTFITGGAFQSDLKTASLDQRTYVAEQDFVVASIEYRVIGDGATYQDTVADVKSAIRYLRAHASEYSINPAKVAVWGQSAGGYLAAMTGATNDLPQFDGTTNPGQSSSVQAVVDQFGPSDLAKLAADFDTTMQNEVYAPGSFLAQFAIGADTKSSILDDPVADAAADPATYATPSDPPFLLMHGSADQMVSPSQTLLLHNAIRAKGGRSTRIVVRNANHGDTSVLTGDTTSAKLWSSEQVMGQIVNFLKDNLARP